MKALIVGGKGNLGSALRLIDGWMTVPLGRSDWHMAGELFAGKPDLVICAAGEINQPASMCPSLFVESNVSVLMRTLEYMKTHGLRRIFFVSSCAVYGASSRTTEGSHLSPLSLNGHAKLLCEKMLQEFCSVNKIDCVILRLFNIFGGSDSFSVMHHLNKCLRDGVPFNLNNSGRAQRDFVHVGDVAKVIFELAKKDNLPTIINIGSGVAVKVADVVSAFKLLHPELQVSHGNSEEVEYSRADIDRLNALITYRFSSIFDFVL